MSMQSKLLKIGCVLLVMLLCVGAFSGCELSFSQDTGSEPVAVTLKTDLHDASFEFTYGELRKILDAESLANLFENYENKTDDVTITLTYNDIRARFGSGSDKTVFDAVLALLTDDERAQLDANRTEVLAYYTDIANAVKAQQPETIRSESFWVDDKSIQFTAADGTVQNSDATISKAARLYKDMLMNGLSSVLPNNETLEAGSDLNALLYLQGTDAITALTDADLDAVYSSVNQTTENDSDGNPVVTELTRTVEIHVKPEESAVLHAVDIRDKQAVLDSLNRPENSFTVSDYTMTFTDLTITAIFDAATDELLSISYDKTMHVTATVTGEGTLAPLGTQTIDFDCGSNMFYQFGWPDRATA